MSSWAPTKYKTTNWSSYNDSLKRRGSLSIRFGPQMVWTPPPTGKRGRQHHFGDAAIQACLTPRVLFGMPPGQTTGFVESLLKLVGLNRAVPDFGALCRRRKTLDVSLPYRGGNGPLNLLIDSTGIEAEGEGEWNARKHPYHRNCVSTAGQWAAPNGASGEGYRWESMKKRLRFGLSKSQRATLVTPRCYPRCRAKSPPSGHRISDGRRGIRHSQMP